MKAKTKTATRPTPKPTPKPAKPKKTATTTAKTDTRILETRKNIIVQIMPVWAKITIIQALTGLPENHTRRLFNEKKIRARKLGASRGKRKAARGLRQRDGVRLPVDRGSVD